MNERIQELWAKAVDIAVPETYTSLSWGQIEKIKTVFAELIVRECNRIITNNGIATSEHDQCVRKDCVNEILDNFGVEL